MRKYKKIVESLLESHNDTEDYTQKNLCTKEYYQKLLDNVINLLKKNKDADIQELRDLMYKNSGIEELLYNFFIILKKAPGAVISFGTDKYQEKLIIGNSQEVLMKDDKIVYSPKEMNEDSIFDLASCTKLFTSVAILKLAGEEELRLDDLVKFYLPQFKNLGNHTIFDLLTYQPYYTSKRIDEANSIDEAEKILFSCQPDLSYGKDRYNDIAPMILKYIVEEVTHLKFHDYIKKEILDKVNMNDTFVKIPDIKSSNIVNFNYSYFINSDGNILLRKDSEKGISTDRKAVKLGQPLGILSGHAGLFSTCNDIVSFQEGLINGTILHPDLVREMAKNRTSFNLVRTKSGITYVPYYGFLCNSKHPNKYFSDVYSPLSGSSFSQSGWTGSHMTIDPINRINLAFLSNRTHNRIVSNECKTNVSISDEYQVIDSSLYTFQRKEITNACLDLAIQERILEDIIGKQIKKENSKVKLREIKKDN